MSASTPSSEDRGFLISLIDIADALSQAKKRARHRNKDNNDREPIDINDLEKAIRALCRSCGHDPSHGTYIYRRSFVEESMAIKAIPKLDECLQELAKELDHETDYAQCKKLQETVLEFKSWVRSPPSEPPWPGNNPPSFEDEDEDGFDFEAEYQKLSNQEKRCLVWFTLFPDGGPIRKRELIHWWAGMELLNEESINDDGDAMLTKLLLRGFIKRGRREYSKEKYKMVYSNFYKLLSTSVQSELTKKVIGEDAQEQTSPIVIMTMNNAVDNAVNVHVLEASDDIISEEKDLQAFININELSLDSGIYDWLMKLSQVRVVHLGGWKHDHQNKDYIVVQDLDMFRAFKNMSRVRYLSLQGVSGLVDLPESIYKLVNLRFLNLRGCNNLELLPGGIQSLSNLIHLDLSECYLLDHIPPGIAFLSNLKVLKGFIVNPDDHGDDVRDNRISSSSSSNSTCHFGELAKLKELRKLTIRTRRMNFPTRQDLRILCMMNQLTNLKIAWVRSTNVNETSDGTNLDDLLGKFPATLEKLELKAVPSKLGSRLLGLLREGQHCPWKLLIIGGELGDLGPMEYRLKSIEVLHLRYLPKLSLQWYQFKNSFPNLSRLEIWACPHLKLFPCDKDGVWVP